MASASGAPEDETRGGTASLADQVARARTRVGTRLRARVERDGSVLRGESNLALRSGERLPCRRARGTTRESILLAPRVAARGLTYNPASQFAQAQKDDNRRYLDIASVFDGSSLKGKRVAITGGSRGLGLEIAKAAMNVGAEVLVICRSGTVDGARIYDGVDVTDAEACASAAKKIVSDGGPVDVLINNAGYFYGPCEKVTENSLNFEEELKQIDICAVGPLRVSNALYQAGGLVEGSKIAIVTSQAGSCEWRFTQNKDEGGDYGHHMSRAACNIAGVLLAEELKSKGVCVVLLHPGFNRTEMTRKYESIWDVEGAVPPAEGALRVLHEVIRASLEKTGAFVNCEDGLRIPW
jgi:NAD(P)-dependent dehydrogenase (short-subunit alcohol dehydrogenase family)